MSAEKYFAVKCEKTTTFYINVYAENEWQAQHRAEYMHSQDSKLGYNMKISEITARCAVEIDDAS